MHLNISLASEYIFSIYGFAITNTVFTTAIVSVFLIVASLLFVRFRKKRGPILIEVLRVLIYELLNLTDTVTGSRARSEKVLPLMSTFFLFIVTANLFALVPGFLGSVYVNTAAGHYALLRSPNSDLTTTIALAAVSVTAIQLFSIKELGFIGFIARFINPTSVTKFVMGFFELISESVKIISFSFRLFGNVFAGEILLLVTAFLVPYLLPVPFMILEVFVGIIQAFVFAMLTLSFIKTSTLHQTRSSS